MPHATYEVARAAIGYAQLSEDCIFKMNWTSDGNGPSTVCGFGVQQDSHAQGIHNNNSYETQHFEIAIYQGNVTLIAPDGGVVTVTAPRSFTVARRVRLQPPANFHVVAITAVTQLRQSLQSAHLTYNAADDTQLMSFSEQQEVVLVYFLTPGRPPNSPASIRLPRLSQSQISSGSVTNQATNVMISAPSSFSSGPRELFVRAPRGYTWQHYELSPEERIAFIAGQQALAGGAWLL